MLDCRNGFEGIETSWIVEVCKAMMYVLHETLGLSEEKMIASMDEKRGKLLLAEILNGGNFGSTGGYDTNKINKSHIYDINYY